MTGPRGTTVVIKGGTVRVSYIGFDEDGNAVLSGNSVSFEGAHISADADIRVEAKEFVAKDHACQVGSD